MPLTSGEALRQAAVRIGMTDARVLLCHVLGCSHASLIAHPERSLGDAQSAFLELVARREHGVPVAYLTGTREFYSREFRVTSAVLIPRPETELLVELGLQRLPTDTDSLVLDLGTGSGCIAVTIALERPRSTVVAVDASQDALSVASENARRLNATRVQCRPGDWYDTIDSERFDLIVSNPPYVAEGDPHLQSGDVRFEPATALVAGKDLTAAGFTNVETWPDLAGIGRVTGARLD